MKAIRNNIRILMSILCCWNENSFLWCYITQELRYVLTYIRFVRRCCFNPVDTGNNDDTSGHLRTFYTNLLQYIKNCYPTKHEKSLFECQVIYQRGHWFNAIAAWGRGQALVINFITAQGEVGGWGSKRLKNCVHTKSMAPKIKCPPLTSIGLPLNFLSYWCDSFHTYVIMQ